jgi:hypothetical protein
MGENFDMVAPQVQEHVKKLVASTGMPDTEESLELMAKGWLEKQASFLEQTKAKNMEEADSFSAESPKGALLMTYSGSLITIGPMEDDSRLAEYSSIGLRQDVPESAKDEASILSADVEKDGVLTFEKGPIQKSSPIYAIAVVTEDMDAQEEVDLLSEVTMLLTQDFVDVNKTLIVEED